jgi:hypothetical protein
MGAAVIGRQPRHFMNILESLSDEESDNKINLLIAAVDMVNEQYLMPPCRVARQRSACPTLIAIKKLATFFGMASGGVARLYWRLLHHRIYVFGTTSLAWQDQTMVSICSTALQYFLGLPKEMLLRFFM